MSSDLSIKRLTYLTPNVLTFATAQLEICRIALVALLRINFLAPARAKGTFSDFCGLHRNLAFGIGP